MKIGCKLCTYTGQRKLKDHYKPAGTMITRKQISYDCYRFMYIFIVLKLFCTNQNLFFCVTIVYVNNTFLHFIGVN